MRPAMVDAEIGQRQVRADTGHPAPSCNSGCRMTAWRRVCASALFAGGDDFYFEARRVLQPSRVMVRAPGVGIAVVVQRLPPALRRRGHHGVRSEEHTSELQSRGHLVCRLLLEKKKENSNSNN